LISRSGYAPVGVDEQSLGVRVAVSPQGFPICGWCDADPALVIANVIVTDPTVGRKAEIFFEVLYKARLLMLWAMPIRVRQIDEELDLIKAASALQNC
jgi:hypothetical protein